MKNVLISMIAMLAVACGSSGGGGSSAAAVTCGSKALATPWTGQYYAFDLTGVTTDGHLYTGTVLHVSGAKCNGNLAITGNDCSGTYTTSNSTYGGGGTSDPGCASLNGTYNYTKTSDNVLKLCNATTGSCLSYQ
jgi:hypothetical protein